MKGLRAVFMLLILAAAAQAGNLPPVQTVFVILLENHNWADFKGSADAPFINGTLLPLASHCEQYFNPPGLHPSEPNYLWLEAGTNFGIFDDNDPARSEELSTGRCCRWPRIANSILIRPACIRASRIISGLKPEPILEFLTTTIRPDRKSYQRDAAAAGLALRTVF